MVSQSSSELHEPGLVTEARLAALERRVEVLTGLLEASVWTVIGLALAVVLMTVNRAGGQVWANIFNLLHVVLSGAAALVSLRLSRRLLTRWLPRPWYHYAWAAGAVFALGGGLEFAQRYGPGSPSLTDVAIDMAGGIGALAIELGVRFARRSRLARIAALGGALLLLVALLPSVAALGVVLQRAKRFPVLSDFSSSEAPFISLNEGATLRLLQPRPGEEWQAEVTWPGKGYPGLEVQPPSGNWALYETLVVTLSSDETLPFALEIRVHDEGHSDDYDDRFNRELTVVPGRNEFRIPVAEIARGPRRRVMNLSNIEAIVLFAEGAGEVHRARMSSWRLEGPVGH